MIPSQGPSSGHFLFVNIHQAAFACKEAAIVARFWGTVITDYFIVSRSTGRLSWLHLVQLKSGSPDKACKARSCRRSQQNGAVHLSEYASSDVLGMLVH